MSKTLVREYIVFVGRQHELGAMERLYKKDGFQMVVLYGRRRVGKTTLMDRFTQGKQTLFYTAKEQSPALNLRDFSRTLFGCFDNTAGLAPFESWSDAFAFLAARTQEADHRLVFVFDEFPYAALADPSLPSTLQIAIDHSFKNTNIMLVLSGSNEGFMESKVLGSKSPLYGRRTAQIKLQPFDYYDASAMIPSTTDSVERVRYYATFGGTPYYLSQIDDAISYEENVAHLFFDRSGVFFEEPIMLLRQELREPAYYNSILYAIASGETIPKRIAERAGVEPSTTGKYLKTLEDLGLITRDVPFGDDPRRSKKGLYRLKDPFFAYWYRFVGPNIGAIEAGAGHAVARQIASGSDLTTFIGKMFERVCLQYLARANAEGKLPLLATSFGSWWGTDPHKKEQTDIDAIAANAQEKKIIVAECKWRNEFNVSRTIDNLHDRSDLIDGYEQRWLYLFTKKPIAEKIRKGIADGAVRFIDASMLYRL